MTESHSIRTPEQWIRAFASKRRLRVQRCFDVYLPPEDPATLQVKLFFRKRRYWLVASRTRVVLTGKAEVPVFFSVGAMNHALLTTEPVATQTGGQQVYAARAGFEKAVRDWLQLSAHFKLIEGLGLRPGESLHVARNASMLVILPDRNVDPTFVSFTRLLEAVSEPARQITRRGPLLPPEFAELEPIARKWAIPDDEEREDALRRAGARSRARLKAAIVPRLDDIDRYMDVQDVPLSDKSMRIQQLGELGAELAAAARRAGKQGGRRR